MTRTQHAWLNRAMGLALTSQCNHRHGAVIVRGGSVLSWGVNSNRGVWSKHAEVDALRPWVAPYVGATCYVARVNKQGKPMLSRPCVDCMNELRRWGIRKVVYTPGVEERL